MSQQNMSNFKAAVLDDDTVRRQAPSVFAPGPIRGVSRRYTFVPTARILDGLRSMDWVPVGVEEQRSRLEERRGFQKHLVRLRQADQMQTLDEWNVELVLLNSHDAGCAYQLHAGIYRRICSNGLVLSETSFEAIRFRHSGLQTQEVVDASLRLVDFIPQIGKQIQGFRSRALDVRESLGFAAHALLLRYSTVPEAPISPDTLLTARRSEDEGVDLWRTMNRVQENLIRGGLSDARRDRRGRLRSVRALHGIDSRVTLNKGLWGLAEKLANGETLPPVPEMALTA